jgi:hypothetical protein
MRRTALAITVVALLASVALPSAASAQATRTWVSGVGDDANPCSRTAPCKTFAGAISKTQANGIINALDPGGFGAVTITKSITIDGGGSAASILGVGTNGVNVNDSATASPQTIKVTLRNLRIEGANGGINGVNVISGKKVRIEDCVIWGYQNGVNFQPAVSPTRLIVDNDRIYDNSNDGIKLTAGTSGGAGTANRLTVVNSSIQENANNGVEVTALGTFKAVANVFRSSIADNGASAAGPLNNNGLLANGGNATVRISENEVSGNIMGLQTQNGAAMLSFQNNRVGGNNVDGVPTMNVPHQ